MSKSIFITRKIPDIGIRLLEAKGYKVDVYPHDDVPTQEQLIACLKMHPYDAVLCLLTDVIDAKVFDAAPTVKLFAMYTVGYNNVDVAEAHKRGIIITNTSGSSRLSVAEHTFALILGLSTRMVEADDFVRKGLYKGWTPMAFIGKDVSGATLGLIGTGLIGSKVARIAFHGFATKIIYYDVKPNEHLEKEYQAVHCATIDDVLKNADIISLHVPLTDATHHLINAEKLQLMKPTAYLVNTSRGPVIDEKALVEALTNKTIAGAGLDVFEYEPALTEGLSELPNVILTPHIASARESARNEMAEIAAANIIDFFEGKTPRNNITA